MNAPTDPQWISVLAASKELGRTRHTVLILCLQGLLKFQPTASGVDIEAGSLAAHKRKLLAPTKRGARRAPTQ